MSYPSYMYTSVFLDGHTDFSLMRHRNNYGHMPLPDSNHSYFSKHTNKPNSHTSSFCKVQWQPHTCFNVKFSSLIWLILLIFCFWFWCPSSLAYSCVALAASDAQFFDWPSSAFLSISNPSSCSYISRWYLNNRWTHMVAVVTKRLSQPGNARSIKLSNGDGTTQYF